MVVLSAERVKLFKSLWLIIIKRSHLKVIFFNDSISIIHGCRGEHTELFLQILFDTQTHDQMKFKF